MKITQIAGFLGCGKTTLMLKLSKQLAGDGQRKVALLVNEIGEIPVDGKVMEESGMRVKDIGGGCICCEVAATFAKTVYALYREFRPDHMLVEPTGVAVPHQVKLAARMGGRDAKVSLGPAVVVRRHQTRGTAGYGPARPARHHPGEGRGCNRHQQSRRRGGDLPGRNHRKRPRTQ